MKSISIRTPRAIDELPYTAGVRQRQQNFEKMVSFPLPSTIFFTEP